MVEADEEAGGARGEEAVGDGLGGGEPRPTDLSGLYGDGKQANILELIELKRFPKGDGFVGGLLKMKIFDQIFDYIFD